MLNKRKLVSQYQLAAAIACTCSAWGSSGLSNSVGFVCAAHRQNNVAFGTVFPARSCAFSVNSASGVRNIRRKGYRSFGVYVSEREVIRTSLPMKLEDGDSYNGNGLHYTPSEHRHTVIWLHGLGDTAEGWADLATQLYQRKGVFSNTKFIFPTAATRPIKINGGFRMPGWSDIYGLRDDAPEDKSGMEESASRIAQIIDGEVSSGVNPRHIVIGGFSQGGAIAYLSGLSGKHVLGGIVACSSWLPLRNEILDKISGQGKQIPVLHCHGDADEIVSLKWGVSTKEFLLRQNISIQFEIYNNMGHSAVPEELKTVGDFIEMVISKEY